MHDSPLPEAAIFDAALQLPPAQRADHLDHACGDDAALRQRIEALLKACERTSGFLDQPAAAPGSPTGSASFPVAEKPGDIIGPYKLLQQIGEGGCGVVYMAEQEKPVQRRVALKVIKLGMDTKSVIARFEAERQALALMDHPNIAKVLEAGATDAGRPYFVMELVRGVKITEFCDHNNLPTAGRLDLFMQVCRAIQHAHQKGIIHRDIKPSNILVTLHDGVPVPKVIDFGIAKATQGRLTDKTVFTAFEQFLGTPAYTSPEQAEMTSLDIDTRSDIYSLGVLLYELLTGKTPFDTNDLLAAGLDAMRRIIREEEPDRPSTKLSTMLGGELTITANRRQTEPPKLLSSVRGDLDWIVMKCLEKDRGRRYETANGLVSDLQRHLDQEPVLACPPSKLYRFRKLLGRNKLAFAAGMSIAGALVIGLGFATWMFFEQRIALRRAFAAERAQTRLLEDANSARRQAEEDRQTARTEAAKSEQVSQILKDMVEGVGPSVALGRDTTILQEILEKTVKLVDTELTNQPAVEAELRTTLGGVYYALGQNQSAEVMHRAALSLRIKLFGPEHPAVATSLLGLGNSLKQQRRLAEAEALHRAALAMRQKLLGGEHADVGVSLNDLALVLAYEAKRDEAEAMQCEALEFARRRWGNAHINTATSLQNLGSILHGQSKLKEAEDAIYEARKIYEKVLPNEHPNLVFLLKALGSVLYDQGKLNDAEDVHRAALAMIQKLWGREHSMFVRELCSLATVLEKQRKFDETEAKFREALELAKKLPDHDRPQVASALGKFASYLERKNRLAEADQMYREALAFPPDDPSARGLLLHNFAVRLQRQGNLPEAETTFRAAVAIRRELVGGESLDVASSLRNLGFVLQLEKKSAEAEASYREALAMEIRLTSSQDQKLAPSLDLLAGLLREEGKFAEAGACYQEALDLWRAGLPATEKNLIWTLAYLTWTLLVEEKFTDAEAPARELLAIRQKQAPDDWRTFNSLAMLGRSFLGQKRYADAEKLLVSGYEGMRQRELKISSDYRVYLREAMQPLVQLYEATDRSGQAAEWKEKLADFDRSEAEKKPTGPRP